MQKFPWCWNVDMLTCWHRCPSCRPCLTWARGQADMVDWTGLHVTALLLLTAARHGGETEQKFRANSQSKLVQSKLSDQTVIRNGRVHFLGPHTPTKPLDHCTFRLPLNCTSWIYILVPPYDYWDPPHTKWSSPLSKKGELNEPSLVISHKSIAEQSSVSH